MGSNMPFRKMKRIFGFTGIAIFLLTLFIIGGCAGKKSETAQTSENESGNQNVIDTGSSSGRELTAIGVENLSDGVDVQLKGNQRLVYTSIKQSFPFGIAIYLPDTQIASGLVPPLSNNSSIGDILVTYADREKTTTKVEILLNDDLDYEVSDSGNVLNIALSDTAAKDVAVGYGKESQSAKAGPGPKTQTPSVSQQPVVVPDKTATMTDIEFTTLEDGKSDIIVKTTHPVRYDIVQGKENKLYLNLYNTVIPDHHKRPILTYYFKSAVESLMPIQMPGKRKNSKVEINTRDQVPYRVVQDQNTISLFFEPSDIEPPVFTKAKKKVASGSDVYVAGQQPMDGAKTAEISESITDEKAKDTEEDELRKTIFGEKKVYTGEKIKLDFFETDIKNVFRILRSIGRVNFAIDKDVKGKVTLTLEDPVPWDQVMDLVLKMNNLGQVREGNVIRIATLQTLTQEEQQIQDAIAAKRKSIEQKKSLQPLLTEYIPINYSEAEKDIKPHLEQIITEGRGKVSVDKRTNMIIITDTQAKIDQAKEIIFRLDRVTPQIMIEAKIVEVTKEFSKALGVGLGVSDNNTATSEFDVALNQPVGAPLNTGAFNFFRLFGSSQTSLNVQLQASESKGDAKIISSPRVLTLDNKSAKIKQGFEVGYQVQGADGVVTVEFKDVDLLLEVTPHVTPDNRIAMTVFVTKNDIDGYIAGVPTLFTNEAETELLVNDQDTIVIAGIVKTSMNEDVDGTPGLSKIPILGRLFRTEAETEERNELLIFITPSIVQLKQKAI